MNPSYPSSFHAHSEARFLMLMAH